MIKIGRYERVRKTGSHGLDALYEAFDPVMNRVVTIRMADRTIDPGVSANRSPDFDIRQIAALDHPNIVKVLAYEEGDDIPYLVLESADGTPLSRLIADGKTISRDEVTSALKKAASALDHAHAKGLLHAHLTAESLLVSDAGLLKVSGFDVARPAEVFHSNVGALHPAALMNAVRYMSPELVQGDALDGRADQFSLACIAIEALTGAALFRDDSPLDQMRKIVFETPKLADLFSRYGFPSTLTGVFEKALAKAPAGRFASCGEFAVAIEMALIVKPVPAPTRLADTLRSVTAAIQVQGGWTRYRLLLIGGALIAAGLVAMSAYFVFRTPTAAPYQRPQAGPAPTTVAPSLPADSPVTTKDTEPADTAAPQETDATPSAAPAKVEVRTARPGPNRKNSEPVTRPSIETDPEKMKPVEPKVVQ